MGGKPGVMVEMLKEFDFWIYYVIIHDYVCFPLDQETFRARTKSYLFYILNA